MVDFAEGLERAEVRVCASGTLPRQLRRLREGGEDLITAARSEEGEVRIDGIRIYLPAGLRCMSYELDLGRTRGSRSVMVADGELLAIPGVLLWLPPALREETEIALRFRAPGGAHVSTSWAGELVPHTLLRWSGNLAITRSATQHFVVDGVDVEVARFQGELTVDEDGVERWLSAALRAARTLEGGARNMFGQERLHIALVPVGPGSRPVAFGFVRRGGGPSVMLYVHSQASTEELVGDWVAVHELSHLSLPKVSDRWVGEGYATYMQEVLRMQQGLQSAEQGWGRLMMGMHRGREGAGMALAEESRVVSQTRTYHHVYWSGAAFFMELDLALHERGTSLGEVVRRVSFDRSLRWDGERCLRALDDAIGASLAVPLAARWAQREVIPDMSEVFASLGVHGSEDAAFDDVRFDVEAPRFDVLRAISGRAAPSPRVGASRDARPR